MNGYNLHFIEMNRTPTDKIVIWNHDYLTWVKPYDHRFDVFRQEKLQVKFRNHPNCATFNRGDDIYYVQFIGSGWTKELAELAFKWWYERASIIVDLNDWKSE